MHFCSTASWPCYCPYTCRICIFSTRQRLESIPSPHSANEISCAIDRCNHSFRNGFIAIHIYYSFQCIIRDFQFYPVFIVLRLHVKGAQQHLKPDCNSMWQNTWLYIKYWTVTIQQKWHFTLGKKNKKKTTNTVAYKPICDVSPSISSQNLVLKGLCWPTGCHASFFYCWVANYSNGRKKRKEKQRGGKQPCFFAPIALQEFYAFDFFFFQ